jgi:itaconyl-CoA hydratase
VDSTFALALVTGQSVTDVSQNVFANLGWDEVRLRNPLFEGDTIYSQSEVLVKRESRSRWNVGVITAKTTGYNYEGEVVIEFMHTILVLQKGPRPTDSLAQPQRTCPPEERVRPGFLKTGSTLPQPETLAKARTAPIKCTGWV